MTRKTTVIKQAVLISASPEEVYDALVDAKKHASFTGSGATSDPKVGGMFTAWDEYITGKNLVLDKGKRLVQEWKTTEWPEDYPPSILEFTFKKNGAKTELTMIHSKVPESQAKSYGLGWQEHYWKPLELYFSSVKKTRP